MYRLRWLIKAVLILAVLSSLFGPARVARAQGPGPSAPAPAYSCGQTVRIMPLGDSITRGSSSGTPADPQYYISYRRDLYLSLTAQGYRVNFVGSRRTDGAAYTDFDRDHEGWPGKRDEYIADNIYNWLKNNPAEVILLHIGTNDMDPANPDTRADDVKRILQEIDRFSPKIWVLVARIIQETPYNQNIALYNKNVNSLLDARIKSGDKILKVNMETGAGILYAVYPDGDLYDEKHPYATGYAKIAAKWEEALKGLLPSCRCASGNSPGADGGSQLVVACVPRVWLPLVDYRAGP